MRILAGLGVGLVGGLLAIVGITGLIEAWTNDWREVAICLGILALISWGWWGLCYLLAHPKGGPR